VSEREVLNLKEAAEFVRVSPKTLREKAKARQVPAQRVGREWRFLKKALEDWLAGAKAAASGTGTVADAAGQMYLAAAPKVKRAARAGFGDTAFTRNRDTPIHRWVPWIAGFSAGFVGEVLDRELAAKDGLSVLDPFAGVGTTLVEAAFRGCKSTGFEINPYAALACRVKFEALQRDPKEIRALAGRLHRTLRAQLADGTAEPSADPPPGFRTRDPFLSPRVERQVRFVADFIEHTDAGWQARLLRVALGSVLVGISNYSYEPSLGRRVSAGKEPILDADVPAILRDKLDRMAGDIEQAQAQHGESTRRAEADVVLDSYLTSGRDRLGEGAVDVLITSPPYLNNYHYVRNTRPQMFWLGLAEEAADLRELATSSFGKFWQTVRTEPQIELAFEYPELAEKLALLRSLHAEKGAYGGPGWANYAATYFNDCARFCEVTAHVMRPGGLAVVVIGNNILQGIEFKTDEFFAAIAERAGFDVAGLHRVRKKRTGSSIVHSSVRVGVTKKKTGLYETAVELRRR
jgi:excisionase family DNA binding protein